MICIDFWENFLGLKYFTSNFFKTQFNIDSCQLNELNLHQQKKKLVNHLLALTLTKRVRHWFFCNFFHSILIHQIKTTLSCFIFSVFEKNKIHFKSKFILDFFWNSARFERYSKNIKALLRIVRSEYNEKLNKSQWRTFFW